MANRRKRDDMDVLWAEIRPEAMHSAMTPHPPAPRHEFEEHTSEEQLLVEAPTLAEVFAEAGRALAELMAGEPQPQAESELQTAQTVELQARDREALLVDWLNELVYRAEIENTIFDAIAHVQLDPPDGVPERPDATAPRKDGVRLRAQLRGTRMARLRNPVKAATLHGISVDEGPDGFAARVVLDV